MSNLKPKPTPPGDGATGRTLALAALVGAAAGLFVLLVALGVVLVANRENRRADAAVTVSAMGPSPEPLHAEAARATGVSAAPAGGEPLQRPSPATTTWRPRSERERSLVAAIEAIADRCPGHMAATLIHPQYDLRVSIDGDEPKPAADVIDLCILISALRRVATGELSLDAPVGGGTTPLRYLLTWMITESDNTAANAVIDAIGLRAIDGEIHEAMRLSPKTTLRRKKLDFEAQAQGRDNLMTTDDIARLLVGLKNRGYTPDNLTAFACQLLRQQQRRTMIPMGIPRRPGVEIANVTGELPGVQNDAAIVYDGNTWWVLVVAVSDCTAPDQARQAIADVARAAWETLHPQPKVAGE